MGEWDPDGGPDGTGGVVPGAAVRHAHDRRDAMGRVVERLEMEKDASVPQVSRILDDADAAKHGATGPQVQPGSLDDGFMDLKLDTDSVGPQIQPGAFDDLSGLGGLGAGRLGGGTSFESGDATTFWRMDLDLALTLDDLADGLDHMRGNTHTSDPWG